MARVSKVTLAPGDLQEYAQAALLGIFLRRHPIFERVVAIKRHANLTPADEMATVSVAIEFVMRGEWEGGGGQAAIDHVHILAMRYEMPDALDYLAQLSLEGLFVGDHPATSDIERNARHIVQMFLAGKRPQPTAHPRGAAYQFLPDRSDRGVERAVMTDLVCAHAECEPNLLPKELKRLYELAGITS